MNEKDVLKKLNTLKELKPAADWKSSARELLLSRLENSSEAVKIGFFEEAVFEFRNFFSLFAQPAFAAIGLFVLLAGSVFGASAARNTKPGDSFYAARVLGQKARVAVTIDAKAKAKLEMKYASTRAKEITQVLSDPSFDSEANKKKVEKLSQDFKAEIKTVNDKYEEINKINGEKVAVAVPDTASSIEDDNMAVGIGRPASDDGKVFAVDSSRATTGIQISQPSLSLAQPAKSEASPVQDEQVIQAVSTSSVPDFKKNLSDAVTSIDTQDFAAAKDILDQLDVDEIINNIDNGEVKGVFESATSVSEMIGADTVSSSQEQK
jgi:hypothetical protein